MNCQSGKKFLLAAALWHVFGAQNIVHAEEIRRHFSLSLQNGLYAGAEFIGEELEGGTGGLVITWSSIRTGWSGTLRGFAANLGLSYESSGIEDQGHIKMHTQLSQSLIASRDHNLGLSMRLNVATPVDDMIAATTESTVALHDVWAPAQALTVHQALTLTSSEPGVSWGSYTFGLNWQPNKYVTFEVPLTVGVPLSESTDKPDVSVSGRFILQF